MKHFKTILEALNHHAVETPDKVVFTWVDIKCVEQNKMTFKQLEDQSNAVAARLLKLGCQKRDRVMIAYPFGLEFLAGMFGAMKIGVIPCSIYPPNPNQLKTEMPKFRVFAKDAGAKYALSTNVFAAGMTAASILYKTGVKWIGTDKLPIKKCNPNKSKDYETFVGKTEEICFIQYTSGSTGCPKGVMISHNNLVEDIWAISRVLGTNAVGALWLPQYHDMGLVSGFMSALYAGVHVIMASPIDFIMRPLLWTDMVETYQATHTCAPNFAYALLLKRLKQANKKANWSHVTHAMFAAEPTQIHVVEELAQTLSIKREHVYNLYGLAEAVVFLTGGPAYPDSDGVVCCGPVDSPSVKLRIVEDGKEVEDGQVGTIWVQSPCVAAGYYGQSQLTASTFANGLPGYEGTWLDTGDLGRVLSGQLYVTGRVKDVIIINGKNYYPTDVELSIDDIFGDVIRPGRTTAFQYGEDSVGVTVEGRKGFDKAENEDLAVQIANHVSQVHGLLASEVLVLKLGVTPKTTSGKLKRSEIRRTTIAGDWKDSSVFLQFKRLEGGCVPELGLPDIDLSQTNALPSKAVEAVHAVVCNPSKLDEYFDELHLVGVSGIEEAWSIAIKTTAAMQAMCSQILKHLEDKHPSICQLADTLCENPDWLLIEDRTDFLLQLVHQILVLEWVTTFMMDNPECMQQKLQNDADWENTHETTQKVPTELQEMLDLPDQDPIYGKLPFFHWIKSRSVAALLKLVLQSLGSSGPTINAQVERINDLLCLNLFEAIWVEQKHGHKENSEVGRRLATNPVMTATTQSKKVFMEHVSNTSAMNNMYIDWQMHIVAWVGDRNASSWMVSKLLLPCIIGDVGANFFSARLISLYLVTQVTGRKLMPNKFHNEPILSRRALHYFGKLNLSCAEKFGYTPLAPNSKHQLALDEENWMSKFDQWGLADHPAKTSTAHSRLHDTRVSETVGSDKVSAAIMSVFGSHVDTSKTWAENGLTSLKSAELRNTVEEQLHVVLPANFEQLYPTPNALALFVSASENKSFPIEEACNYSNLPNLPRSRPSKPQLGILQALGSVMIILLFLSSILPSYFLASWAMNHCESNKVGECNSPVVWILLPMSVPLYLISFSVIVVFCKYAVIGTYLHRQIELLSWGYLQWWFLDRLLEVWEYFVGRFIVETKFIWVFYWLLGVDLAWSTRIESFIREFDLVTIGENTVISHPIKCRKFSQSTETGPTVTFRPIIIGNSCQVSGMVGLGASIGDNSKVEKLSVVEEGAQVPDGVLARGNPACHSGIFEPSESQYWEENLLDAFKIDWLFLEAYHYFALSFLVHTTLNKILPSWRYAAILHWFLLFFVTALLALITSIALKWLLIGKRKPSDEYGGSLYRRATNWACDFHFRVAARTLTPFIGVTKLWHVILFLHGLDVDSESLLNNPYIIFFPSKVDFVKIRKSFVATISLDFRKQSTSKIEIIKSSIGYGVNLHAGVKIMQSSIPPRLDVAGNVYDLNPSGRASQPSIFMDFVLPEITQIFLAVVLFASLIPSYELGLAFMNNATTGVAVFVLLVAVLLQLFVWVLSSRVFEAIQLNLPTGVQLRTFGAYITNVWFFRVQNVLELLLAGTPMFTYYARMLGAEVEGDLWYFGNALYECGKLHFKGCTIVDNAHVSAHYIDRKGLTIAGTHVSGVLHPGCYASAGSVVSYAEHGPWKVFLRSDAAVKDSNLVLSECRQSSTDLFVDESPRACILNHEVPDV